MCEDEGCCWESKAFAKKWATLDLISSRGKSQISLIESSLKKIDFGLAQKSIVGLRFGSCVATGWRG
jgi:hypothetical protein